MNKKCIELWNKNEHKINIELFNDININSKKLYQKLSLIIAKNILELDNIKELNTDRYETYNVSGTYKNLFNITFSGDLQYGTCEECDLTKYILSSSIDTLKGFKAVMLNIIQAAFIDVEELNQIDIDFETASNEEVDKYLEREELVTKEYVEWIKDTTNENVLNVYRQYTNHPSKDIIYIPILDKKNLE